MDRDGTMTIDWQEWRDHFLLHSLENMEDVLHFWKHSTVRWGWLSQPGGQALSPPGDLALVFPGHGGAESGLPRRRGCWATEG